MSTKRRVVEDEAEMEDAEEVDTNGFAKLGTGIPVTPIGPSRPTQLLDTLMLHRLMERDPVQHCMRQGVCCTRIMLPVSPRDLRESYNAWIRQYKERGSVALKMTASEPGSKMRAEHLYGEIELLYPMLAGRCLGKMWLTHTGDEGVRQMHRGPKPSPMLGNRERAKQNEQLRYVYGPCKHFAWKTTDTKLHGVCTIHDIRPNMCRDYPHYSNPLGPNMGMWKGCGYNVDADYGLSEADFKEPLEQLEDNEV